MADFKQLVLRRNALDQLCLYDAETGEPLQAQRSVEVLQEAQEPTLVRVTFLANGMHGAVKIEINDGG